MGNGTIDIYNIDNIVKRKQVMNRYMSPLFRHKRALVLKKADLSIRFFARNNGA